LREKETLLREIHHRVKNNLQIIASLLYFEGQKIMEPAGVAAFADIRQRLNAMILVHEKLYRSSDLSRIDFADYLVSLVGEMERLQSTRVPPIAGRVSSDAVELPIESALPCGMIVTELVTNAYKHAFPNGEAGSIDVRMVRAGDRVTLTVSDDGIGLPADFDLDRDFSFGWRLVRNLADQVGGTIAVTGRRGTSVSVTIPYGSER
jgi:two-component sensor histidine kinase